MNCASGVAAICSLLMSPKAVDVSNLAEQETPKSAIAQPLRRSPSVEFYSWSWATTRRSWNEWLTATAAIGSSLEELGWRLRATGGFGGYASDVKGSDAENVIASAMEVDDIALPHIGTVGKYYGSDGFVGAQIGYALIDKKWEVSGFLGVGITTEGYRGANMKRQFCAAHSAAPCKADCKSRTASQRSRSGLRLAIRSRSLRASCSRQRSS